VSAHQRRALAEREKCWEEEKYEAKHERSVKKRNEERHRKLGCREEKRRAVNNSEKCVI